MRSKSGPARQLATQFARSENPLDEFSLVTFNDEPNIASALTTDTGKVRDNLALIRQRGGSALWDAVYLALTEVERGRNARKALLVISGGEDTSSHYTEHEIANAVRDAAVPIYSVGVFEPDGSRSQPSDRLKGAMRLRQAAEQSGGHYFAIESLEDIQLVVGKITDELRAPVPAAR